jgi:hypothetical protein
VWEAHSQHAYQQAVRNHNTHDAVVRWILAGNILLVVLSVLAAQHEVGLPALGMGYSLAVALRCKLTFLKPSPVILTPAKV